jgi:hypothetical protein
VSALLVLSLKESNSDYLLVSGIILFLFWLLDSFYLHKEKLFRDIFEIVRNKNNQTETDFNMSFDQLEEKGTIFDSAISHTMLIFYGGIELVHLVVLSFI